MLRDPRLRTLSWQVSRQLQLQLQRVFVVEQRWWRLQLGRTQEAPVGRWENAFATTTTRAPTPQPSGGAQGLCSAPATIFVCVCVCVCLGVSVFRCAPRGAHAHAGARTLGARSKDHKNLFKP
jgi:hypothetical protein